MRRQSRIGSRGYKPTAGPFKSSGPRDAGTVRTRHQLLTSAWTLDVERLEMAIGGFTADRPLAADCQVNLFEMAGDRQLHVNVTHPHVTVPVPGWAGPGRLAGGFVHNRRFVDTPANQIVRHIRDVVFAARA